MLNPIIHKFKYGKHTIKLETGIIARQATAAVMVSMDDTVVFLTVVVEKKVKPGQSFFPLTVTYQERTYAAGRFPGGFFRREGRQSECEILISRLIDRSIRPLFPKDFMNEVQIIATVVSVNPQISPDIVSIIGASAALSLSGIPFNLKFGAARVGYINNKYILNPTKNDLTKSKLDLIIAATESKILMIESESKILSEDKIIDAVIYGQKKQSIVINNINTFVNKAEKKQWKWQKDKNNIELKVKISNLAKIQLKKAYCISEKKDRNDAINFIKSNIIEILLAKDNSINENEIKDILINLERSIVRKMLLHGNTRIDGRKNDIIRNIYVSTGILPRTHGSAIFTRGDTQSLVSVTLGTERDAQNIDELTGERIERFILHYNFPPYCVGETGIIGVPKRREIGHGNLAKRAILAVLPDYNKFNYTVRVVSEITESNGSSSMASICGASLALMDAGVPINSAVAGIAMGLVKEGNDFVILSDILDDEDHFGDMDFKIAGTYEGITALQMDIKTDGITIDIIKLVINQAKLGIMQILGIMNKIISSHRKNISKFAPRIYIIKISPDKIKNLIGKGGSVIRSLTEKTETTIEIKDDGTVKIAAINKDKAISAIRQIEEITDKIEIGRIYKGIVTRILEFGVLVNFGLGKDGLVHISKISDKRVEKITDYLKVNQKVLVKVLEIDRIGRIRLSIKY